MFTSDLTRQLAARRKVGVFEGLMRNDERLVEAGFPPISPFWKENLKKLYAQGKSRLVIRVGRRGGKSSTMARVAVAEGLYGNHPIPPGDVGVFVFVSVRQEEAKERLRTIGQILDHLNVPYQKRATEIQLIDKPVIFRVYPANFRTIVGMTCIGFVADECARWRDDELGANPAKEVLASLRPAMATMPDAKEFLSSSPFAKMDAHYHYFEMGNTDEQNVAYAPTWVANPTLTIARCKQLEPDEPTFRREYEGIPMENEATQFFDSIAIDMSMVLPPGGIIKANYGEFSSAGADFAFTNDWSALAVAHRNENRYKIGEIDVLKPKPGSPLKPSEVCARFAFRCRYHGLRGVMADGHYKESIVEHLAAAGLAFMEAPSRPVESYVRARSLIYQGLVELPKDTKLREEFLQVQARPTPNGSISLRLPRGPDGGHADRVSAIVLALFQRGGVEKVKPREEHGLEPLVRQLAEKPTPYNFEQEGWSKDELDEVRKLERAYFRQKNRKFRFGGPFRN